MRLPPMTKIYLKCFILAVNAVYYAEKAVQGTKETMVAAISAVSSSFVSAPVQPLRSIGASASTASVQTASAATTAAAKTVNFGPAAQVQISPQAQKLLAANTSPAAANANSSNTADATANATAANTQSISQNYLTETYQLTAQQIWNQVLNSMGLTQQSLAALPISQRNAEEVKAEVLAQNLLAAQVAVPPGVSQSEAASSIAAAISAVA